MTETTSMRRKKSENEPTFEELEKIERQTKFKVQRFDRGVPADDLTRLYLKEIEEYNVLSSAEEQELFMRKDAESKKILVECNLKLVVYVAERYVRRNISFLDLVQEGNVGLLEAVEKFDYTKGVRFGTYAIWKIRHTIVRYIQNNARMVRVPVYTGQIITKLSQVSNDYQLQGREPALDEIAREMKISIQQVQRVLKSRQDTVSLDAPFEGCCLGDSIEDEQALVDLYRNVENENLADQINALMGILLTKREQEVIALRFGLTNGKPMKRKDIGNRLNVSAEMIRQTEEKAIRKLRGSWRVKVALKPYWEECWL